MKQHKPLDKHRSAKIKHNFHGRQNLSPAAKDPLVNIPSLE